MSAPASYLLHGAPSGGQLQIESKFGIAIYYFRLRLSSSLKPTLGLAQRKCSLYASPGDAVWGVFYGDLPRASICARSGDWERSEPASYPVAFLLHLAFSGGWPFIGRLQSRVALASAIKSSVTVSISLRDDSNQDRDWAVETFFTCPRYRSKIDIFAEGPSRSRRRSPPRKALSRTYNQCPSKLTLLISVLLKDMKFRMRHRSSSPSTPP